MRVSKVLDFFLVEQGEISAFRADFGKNQQVKTDFLLFKICTVLKLFFMKVQWLSVLGDAKGLHMEV